MKISASPSRCTLFIIIFVSFLAEFQASSYKFPPPYSFKETQNNITLKVSTKKYNANLSHLLEKSRLLRKYNVIELEITNTTDVAFELNAHSISQHIHPLRIIQRRVRVLSWWDKFWLYTGYFFSGLLLGGSLSLPAYERKSYADSEYGYYWFERELYQSKYIAGGLLALLTCIGVSIADIISKSHKQRRMQDLLNDKILEPNDTIIIAPGATVHRFLFCPRETFNPHFSIKLINQKTLEQTLFNPLMDRYK